MRRVRQCREAHLPFSPASVWKDETKRFTRVSKQLRKRGTKKGKLCLPAKMAQKPLDLKSGVDAGKRESFTYGSPRQYGGHHAVGSPRTASSLVETIHLLEVRTFILIIHSFSIWVGGDGRSVRPLSYHPSFRLLSPAPLSSLTSVDLSGSPTSDRLCSSMPCRKLHRRCPLSLWRGWPSCNSLWSD